jgi:Helix-turn-helix domain
LLYSVAQTCKLIGLAQSSVYVLISKGELEAVRFENVDAIRITGESIKCLIERGKGRKPRAYQRRKGQRIRSKSHVA